MKTVAALVPALPNDLEVDVSVWWSGSHESIVVHTVQVLVLWSNPLVQAGFDTQTRCAIPGMRRESTRQRTQDMQQMLPTVTWRERLVVCTPSRVSCVPQLRYFVL